MPVPWVPIVAGATQLIGQGFNAFSQGRNNRAQERFALGMYNRQRQDALTDRAFENEYNSPAAQMKRLMQAGLNPHLVYGNGTVANQGEGTRGAQGSSYNPKAPELNLGFVPQLFMMMYDLMQKQASANSLNAAADASRASASNTGVRTAREGIGLQYDQRTLDDRVERALLENRRIDTDIIGMNYQQAVLLNRDEREAALNSQSVVEAAERILKIRAETANTRLEYDRIQEAISLLRKENVLREFDVKLTEQGSRSNDQWIFRKIQGLFHFLQKVVGGLFNLP